MEDQEFYERLIRVFFFQEVIQGSRVLQGGFQLRSSRLRGFKRVSEDLKELQQISRVLQGFHEN